MNMFKRAMGVLILVGILVVIPAVVMVAVGLPWYGGLLILAGVVLFLLMLVGLFRLVDFAVDLIVGDR